MRGWMGAGAVALTLALLATAGAQVPLGARRTDAAAAATSGDRAAALNAVFDFREDLRGGATKVARCRIEDAVSDTAAFQAIDPRFRALFTAAPSGGCAVADFMRDSARVIWVESIVEV